jgi:hypothetical protein
MAFIVNNWRQAISDLLGLSYRVGYGNYFKLITDFSSATWNTVATHETHVVTGAVRMIVLPQIVTSLASATGTISFGVETAGTSLIAATAQAALTGGTWWLNATNVGAATRLGVVTATTGAMDLVVANGADLGLAVATAAFTAGRIDFHTWWVPLDDTGMVTPGLGGTLS